MFRQHEFSNLRSEDDYELNWQYNLKFYQPSLLPVSFLLRSTMQSEDELFPIAVLMDELKAFIIFFAPVCLEC